MTLASRDGVSAPFVKIGWYGHAMFLVEDDRGTRVVTDPFDPVIGYAFPDLAASVVLVSHGHYDHNNAGAVKGNPVVIREAGNTLAQDVEVKGLAAAHDTRGGAERGPVIIYRWSMAGMSFAHLGDLGHPLTPELATSLRNLDVLFIPVGGHLHHRRLSRGPDGGRACSPYSHPHALQDGGTEHSRPGGGALRPPFSRRGQNGQGFHLPGPGLAAGADPRLPARLYRISNRYPRDKDII